MENEDETPAYTRLYFVAAKLRALSFFLENGLLDEQIVPSDVDQIKEGAGLLLKEMSQEIKQLGEEVEGLHSTSLRTPSNITPQ